jgi:dipeptidyl aminopeptidase/acylaminoacyl peptidase
LARRTHHAGQVSLTVSSAHGEQHLARRAYPRIAGFMARLRQSAEQLDALGRWYRILSEALRHYLHRPAARTGGRPYPPILIATSRHDDSVHPGHARKMAAKMQAMGYEAYFYEPAAGGHG